MKTKTETILIVSKFLALLGGIWFSILCGSQLLTLVASFINPEWAKRTYEADLNIFSIRKHSIGFYVCAMCLAIAVSAIKALIWYVVFELLQKLKLQTPFTMEVEKKLERIAYLLLGVWIVSSIFWKIYIYYLLKATAYSCQLTTVEMNIFSWPVLFTLFHRSSNAESKFRKKTN